MSLNAPRVCPSSRLPLNQLRRPSPFSLALFSFLFQAAGHFCTCVPDSLFFVFIRGIYIPVASQSPFGRALYDVPPLPFFLYYYL